MAGYLIASYRITNPQGYEAYVPAVVPTLDAHGAELLVADYASDVLEGDAPHVTVVLKFPSKAAAHAWYNSPEYQAVVHHRTDNTVGTMVVTDAWTAPA